MTWISGQVVYTLSNHTPTNHIFVVNGPQGNRLVHSCTRQCPALGDRVRFQASDDDSPWALVTHYETLGHAAVPPPQEIRLSEVHSQKYQLQLVRLRGIVIDAFRDEIDSRWNWLLLRGRGTTVPVAWPSNADALERATQLIGAEVQLDGCNMLQHRGNRYLLYALVEIHDLSAVKVLTSPAANHAKAPPMSLTSRWQPDGFQSICGRVTASWGQGELFLRTAKGQTLQVSLKPTLVPPAVGDTIRAVGFAEKNNFYIAMHQADWAPLTDYEVIAEPPAFHPTIAELTADDHGYLKFYPEYNGCPIALKGIVGPRRIEVATDRFTLDAHGLAVTVILPREVSGDQLPAPGSCLEVSGICRIEFAAETANSDFPRIHGFSVITRTPGDLVVLATPPWWNSTRLMGVIGILIAVLIGIFFWNLSLRRRAERRGQELAEAQLAQVTSQLKVSERTRLAVELHDALSQTLTGVSMQIDTAADLAATKIPAVTRCLTLASRTVDACRMELRNTLWDLRGTALDEPDMNTAIRMTLCQNLDHIRLSVRFNVPRTTFSDNTAYAVLKIIRELAANALRHGRATALWIAGAEDGGQLRFSVRDNGCGFDPDRVPGIGEGHFGLQGIAERLERFNGKMTVDSTLGKGTKVAIAIPLPPNGE